MSNEVESSSGRKDVKSEAEMLEKELLNLKGRDLEEALKSYRRLLKKQNKPLYLTRSYE